MSAFQCSDSHISALAGYAAHHGLSYVVGYGPASDAARVGAMLHTANVASMNARYRKTPHAPTFVFNASAADRAIHCPAVSIIKAANCLDCQSNEVEGWTDTRAAECLRSIVNHAIGNLPGYDAAAWGSPLVAMKRDPNDPSQSMTMARDEAEAQEVASDRHSRGKSSCYALCPRGMSDLGAGWYVGTRAQLERLGATSQAIRVSP